MTFPANKKPYEQQVGMMRAIVEALQQEGNALIESPTGTGKSLAILSSVMAWQAHLKSAMSKAQEVLDKPPFVATKAEPKATRKIVKEPTMTQVSNVDHDDDDDDFQVPVKYRKTHVELVVEDEPIDDDSDADETDEGEQENAMMK